MPFSYVQKGQTQFLPVRRFVFHVFGCSKTIWRCQLVHACLPRGVSCRDKVAPANHSLYKLSSVLQVALEALIFACDGLNGLCRACPRSLSIQVTQQHMQTSTVPWAWNLGLFGRSLAAAAPQQIIPKNWTPNLKGFAGDRGSRAVGRKKLLPYSPSS